MTVTRLLCLASVILPWFGAFGLQAAGVNITTTSPLPAGVTSTAYSATMAAAGGAQPYTWAATGLPTGLSISTSGVISGTPVFPGTTSGITITVNDAVGLQARGNFSITVTAGALAAYSTSTAWQAASSGTVTTPDFSTLAGNDVSVSSVTLSGATFSGNLNECGGTFPSSCSGSAGYLIGTQTITATLPTSTFVSSASANYGAYFGNAPETVVITATTVGGVSLSFSLDPGTSISFIGFVSSNASDPVQSIVFNELNTSNYSAVTGFSYYSTAYPALSISTASPLTMGNTGQNFSFTMSGSGGSSHLSWSALGLPNGLTMSSAGVINGMPVTGGTYSNVVVTLHDSQSGLSTQKTFAVTINQATTTSLTSSLVTPSVFGKPLTLTATVSPNTVTGKVTFYNGTSVLGQSTLSGGTATINTSLLPAGVNLLRAYYPGNGSNILASTSAVRTQIVNSAAQNGFAAGVPYGTGSAPYRVAVGDFNGDGIPDLVSANFNSSSPSTLSLFLGSSNGTFGTASSITVNNEPNFIAVGDFNGDGKADLAVTGYATNEVYVLLGNGSGGFSPQAIYTQGVGSLIEGIIAVDFNGDGITDLALVNNFSATVSILLGAGDGTFGNGTTFSVGTHPVGIVAGDFNGDGFTDLATVGTDSGVSVLFGTGTGSFGTFASYGAGGSGTDSIVAYDFDRDGHLDLAVTNSSSANAGILRGGANGTFGTATTITVGSTPEGIALVDFNGDGNIDLAVSNDGTNNVSILLGNGSGGFTSSGTYNIASGASGAMSVAVADFNGDGISDLAISNESTNSVSVLLGLATTATSLNSSVNPTTFNGSTTLTATVSPSAATGTVTFFDGATSLGTGTLSSGTASLGVSTLTAGTHSLTASYGGNSVYGTNTSTAVTQTVNKAGTVTSVLAAPNPAAAGQPLTITATVTPSNVTGSVSFTDGGTQFGTAQPVIGGIATITNTFAAGTHLFTGVYSGDSNTTSSTSPNYSESVLNGSTTTLISSLNPSAPGQPVLLTATVSPSTVTGSITFRDGGTTLGVVTLSGGVASFSTSSLIAGSHTLTAVYNGDSSDGGSSSSPLIQFVGNGTSTSLTASSGTVYLGQAITLTATVTPSAATGRVTFYDGATILGDAALSGGTAAFSTPILVSGVRTLRALYQGSSFYLSSQSAAVPKTISSRAQSGFGAPTDYTTGPDTLVSVTGDFNGDGKQDIAVLDYNFSAPQGTPVGLVSVLIGKGDGTFQPAVQYGVGSSPQTLAVGDFNNDGKQDLVVGDSGNGVILLFGTGSGTFTTTGKDISLGGEVSALTIAVADFNNDGIADLLLADTSNVYTAMGVGDGTFNTAQTIISPFGFSQVYTADMNSDGKADAVVYSEGDGGNTLQILLGNGDGTFQSGIANTPSQDISSVAITDFNGDGKPDIVVGTFDPQIFILLGNGDGTMGNASQVPVAEEALFVTTGDFNGDGKQDVLFDSFTGIVYVVPGNGNGTFGTITSTNTGLFPAGVVPGNFSGGTGRADIVIPNGSADDANVLLGLPPGVSVSCPLGSSAVVTGSPYSLSCTSSGGVSPYTYTQTSGTLPAGLLLNSSTGVISGTPIMTGSFSFVIQAADSDVPSQSATTSVRLNIVTPLTPASPTLPSAPLNSPYTATLASGGTTPYTCTLASGSYPATFTLTSSTCVLSGTSASIGSYTFTIAMADSGSPRQSTSQMFSLAVQPLATMTTIGSLPNPSSFGTSVTFTAHVAPSTATGTVTFKDGGTALGSGTLSGGVATFTTSALSVGAHSFTAVYGGDPNDAASASSPLTQTVNQAATTTSLGTSGTPSTFGQSVTFTATVSAPGATGTVTFLDGSTSLGTATLVSGTASFSTSTLSVASHSITAVYGGDISYAGGTSLAVNQVVNKAPTTTTLTSSLNPATWAQSITLTATLSRPSATGTVSFFDGTTQLGTSTVLAGAAAFSTSSLAAGVHSLTAVYSGDASNLASTSAALTETVHQLVTTTTLTSSANPSMVGQSITLTANISSSGATGTVTFLDGTATVGTGTLSSGVATLTISALTVGSHSLTASYGGDPNNTASASSAFSQTIRQIVTTTTLSSSLNPAQFGQSVTLTANVSPSGATGTVTFFDGSVALGQSALSGGAATFSTSALSVGPHSLTAGYNGDTNNALSTSTTVPQSIQQATTTTTLTSSANPSNFGSSLTLSVVVSNPGATGIVTFLDGATTIGSSPVAAGAAFFSTSALSVGSHNLTASYSGDTNYTSSTSSAVSQTINQTPTVTTLTAAPNPSIVGQSVTLVASVSPASATGTVTFKDGSATVGTGTLTAGVATLSTAFLTSGAHTLTASYSGDTNDATSVSNGLSLSLNFLSSINGTIPDSAGQGTGFTTRLPGTGAPITGNDPNLTLNTDGGTLQVSAGATEYIGVPLSSVGVTSSEDFSVSLPLANVQYPNASDQAGIFIGTSGTQVFRGGIANLAGTPFAFSAQTNGSGDSNIQSIAGLAPSPGDNIVLTLSRASGVYSLQLNNLTTPAKSGSIPITQPAFLTGVSGLVAGAFVVGPTETLQGFSITGPAQTVVSATTITTLTSSANPSTVGNSITLTTVVSPALATGTVTFEDGTTVLGTGTLKGGTAAFSTTALNVGSHSLTAVYGGDSNYNPATSVLLIQVVNQIITTTSIGSSVNPGTVGQAVILSAAVSPAIAAGTIAFKDGTNILGTVPLVSGAATLSVSSLTFGSHSLTATYSGDMNDTGSASSALTQSMIFPTLSILTSSLPSASVGQLYGPIFFTAAGGSGNFTWSSSPLPAGLNLTAAGTFGGTPTTTFGGSISVTVTDNVSSLSSSKTLQLSVGASPVSVSGPSTLGDVLVGGAVSGSFTTNGGLGPYTWSVAGVAGLSIDANGHVSGAPTSAGTFTVTVGVADSLGNNANATASLFVLGIATTSLPAGSTTAPYSATISVLGGIPPFTYTATGVPAGITFSNGTFGGQAKSAGTSSVTVQVTDSKGLSVSSTYSLTITGPGPLTVTTTSLPNGAVGQFYSQVVAASGGAPGYSWSQSGGVTPPGLGVDSSGNVTGTPTTPGTYSFGVKATDSTGGLAVGTVSITITPAPLLITTGAPPNGQAGVPYPIQILTASGGMSPYTFSFTGTLPAGLALSGSQITGTPTSTGTSVFSIVVTDSAATPQTADLTANVTIAPNSPDLLLSSAGANFTLPTGATATPAPSAITVTSSIVSQVLNFQVSSSVPWLTATGASSTPGSISIVLNNAALALTANGSPYFGTVTVTCTSNACSGKSHSIAVDLNVGNPAAQLSVDASLLSFVAQTSNPQSSSSSFLIANAGGGTLGIASVTASDSWVTIGSYPSSLMPGPASSVDVTVNPAGLTPGYYRSIVTVRSSAGTVALPVTLFLSGSSSMTLGPAGAQFSLPEGGALGNPKGSFLVSVTSAAPVKYSAVVLPGSAWLSVTDGTGSASGIGPGTVNFAIDPVAASGLAAGAYYGTIRVTTANVINSPQDFQVILSVAPAGSAVTPDPEPAGEVFISSPGNPLPSQTIQLYASSVSSIPYQVSANFIDGSGWLTLSASTGSVSAASPGSVTVNADPTALTPGVYRAGVSFSFANSVVRTVNVTLIVEPPLPAAAPNALRTSGGLKPAASGPSCAGAQLVPTETGLVGNFSAPASWPTPISVILADTCGTLIPNGQLVATFTNGDPPLPLQLVDSTKALYSGTWTPRKVSSQITISARASAPGYPNATAQIAGQVAPNQAPVLAPNGGSDIFNPLVGGGLGPGNIIQIYGSGLASQTIAPAVLPLPTTVVGTSVVIGGVQSPLYYVSPGQINAQIPFELAPNQQYQLIVSANGALTTPLAIQVNAGAPAVLAFTSGAVVAQHQDGTLISASAPAAPGEYIVIYLTGLGATTVDVPSGSASPSSPLAYVSDTPMLRLGTNSVPVLFAGLTPGLVGLYQINFQIPTGLADGSYNLQISQSGTLSNSTLLQIQQ